MYKIEGRIILVTGAAGGMGAAIVKMLAEEKARLALADIDKDRLDMVVQQAKDVGAQVISSVINIKNEEQVQAFFSLVKETYERADVLINLPGLTIASKIEEMAKEDYDLIVDVNLMSAFLSTKHFIPLVDPNRGGQIILTSSQAARRANANAPVYCAAKAAVSMFSQGLALQVKEKNIRVSGLNPGPTDTTGFWKGRSISREKFMKPEDVAEVVKFILNLPKHVVVHDIGFESFEFFK